MTSTLRPATPSPDGTADTAHTVADRIARRRRQAGGTHRRRPPDAVDRPEAHTVADRPTP
ncbi:MAG: hypothetical protein K2K22_07890 [Muribaculaceae bacterium]|nr:hypothetical protein [Muribaculaceae bacterium]